MSYLYLVMSGILFGGVVFGAKVLYLMGASLFEVLFYPNLISVLPAATLSKFSKCRGA